ncbi:nucleotide-binding protein [Chryseobacterium sp. C-71]|uniref:TIR domain-containing protein n=1 Tax=Chryseobacterium sp. C-71 TaxID=2893882 RepID=UPI001E3E342F|nr:nucleotide-binding protein [Chryseobacterium sp. C-71]UFH33355.1 nucleotide-binding protein [Chryseobacterium sp. C-71]
MINLLPKYEVLYNDLQNVKFSSFFKSRDFKSFMIRKDYYDFWRSRMEQIDSSRSVYSVGSDYELWNSTDTFKSLLNDKTFHNEIVIVEIIIEFILFSKDRIDVKNILESLELAQFSLENINRIKEISHVKNSEFPSTQIQDVANKKIYEVKEPNMDKRKIFIVHGHNDTLKLDVARTIEKLNLTPIILHEQVNNGKTIIEKFEKFSDVSFAIILLTADDLGNSKNIEHLNKRARQNVIFELGYFIGKLGRENVMTLKEEGIETPNDISGVVYTHYDAYGNWKSELVKELKSAGFKIDTNNLF